MAMNASILQCSGGTLLEQLSSFIGVNELPPKYRIGTVQCREIKEEWL